MRIPVHFAREDKNRWLGHAPKRKLATSAYAASSLSNPAKSRSRVPAVQRAASNRMVRTRQAEAMVLALAIACWLAPSLRAQTGTTYPGIFDHWENGRRSADTLSAPPIMASGSFHWTQPNFDGDVQVAFPEIPVPTTSNPDSMPAQFTLASKMTVKATLLGKYTITAGAGPSTISISGLMGAGSPSSCTPAPQNITGVAGGAVVSVSYTITCDITALNTTAANDPRGRGLGFFSLQFNLVSGDGKNSVSDFVSADIFYRYLLPTITAISHEVANGGSDNGQNSGDPSQTSLEEIISGTNFPPFGYIILKRSDQNSSAPDSGPSDTSNPPQSDVVVVPATFKNASEIDAKLQGFKAVPEGYYDVILNNGYHRNIATGRRLLYVSSLRLNLEVNQGVPMPCSSSKPCVAQHDMVIRAKVSCDGLTQTGDPCEKGKDRATGRLFLTKPDGTVQTLPAPVPVTVHSVATPASNQDRKQG
jgi:hypothetical protein